MLRNGGKSVEEIKMKLKLIYIIIDRAYDYLSCGGELRNLTMIGKAEAQYESLKSSGMFGIENYKFPEFDEFEKTVHSMDSLYDFFQYISNSQWDQTENRLHAVPASEFVNSYCKVGNVLDVDRLAREDVYEIIKGQYQASKKVGSHTATVVPLLSIVGNIEQNIIALSDGKGMPFSTGLIIHPNMILTARHCLEKRNITDIMVRNNFQKQSDGTDLMVIDFWTHTTVQGVVEENGMYDYAIIWVADLIQNFKPSRFNLGGQYKGSSILIHHPGGYTKKISVHVSSESRYLMLQHNAFHDSANGSSGGVYINANGEIFALHCLNYGDKTGAPFFKDIYETSQILKTLYDINGNYLSNLLLKPMLSIEELQQSAISQEYHKWLETIKSKLCRDYPEANKDRIFKPHLTHHHIIPKSNLEFLWMLGKLYSKIETALKTLAWPQDSGKALIVNNVIWSPWNLFTGPCARPANKKENQPGFDPKNNQFWVEPTKPLSFPKELWGKINELNIAIENAWNIAIGKERSTKVQTIKKKTITALDANNDNDEFKEVPSPIAAQCRQTAMKDQADIVVEKLASIHSIVGQVTNTYKIHLTQDSDWTFHDRDYEIKLTQPPEGSIQDNTLHLYKEGNCIISVYKNKQNKLMKNTLDISGHLSSLLESISKSGYILTDQQKYLILDHLKLLGTYKLRTSDMDGDSVQGLMPPSSVDHCQHTAA